jgi:integrase
MRGHVVKKRGRYYVVVELDKDPGTGKRRRNWIGGFAKKKEADATLAEMVHRRNVGTYIKPSNRTLAEFLPEWLQAIKPTVRQNTWECYRTDVECRLIPALGARRLDELTAPELNAFYTYLREKGRRDGKGGLSPQSVRHVHVVIHRALKDAVRWGLLTRNVADLADPPSQQAREIKTWNVNELRQFLHQVKDDRLFAAYLLHATTGMRRGEVLGLRWCDVDLDQARLSIRQTLLTINYKLHVSEPKTLRSRRTISLDPATVSALRAHRKAQLEERLAWGESWRDTGLVFTREDGEPVHPAGFSDAFERAVKRAQLPRIRLHGLRHTYATLALSASVPLWAVADLLGHSNVSVTDRFYRHAIPSMLEEAASKVTGLILGGDEHKSLPPTTLQ